MPPGAVPGLVNGASTAVTEAGDVPPWNGLAFSASTEAYLPRPAGAGSPPMQNWVHKSLKVAQRQDGLV